jgi:hypothetical protein
MTVKVTQQLNFTKSSLCQDGLFKNFLHLLDGNLLASLDGFGGTTYAKGTKGY